MQLAALDPSVRVAFDPADPEVVYVDPDTPQDEAAFLVALFTDARGDVAAGWVAAAYAQDPRRTAAPAPDPGRAPDPGPSGGQPGGPGGGADVLPFAARPRRWRPPWRRLPWVAATMIPGLAGAGLCVAAALTPVTPLLDVEAAPFQVPAAVGPRGPRAADQQVVTVRVAESRPDIPRPAASPDPTRPNRPARPASPTAVPTAPNITSPRPTAATGQRTVQPAPTTSAAPTVTATATTSRGPAPAVPEAPTPSPTPTEAAVPFCDILVVPIVCTTTPSATATATPAP